MTGMNVETTEFDQFARTSTARGATFDLMHQRLDGQTVAAHDAFGRMPWSGTLHNAYSTARDEILAMLQTATDAMETISTNIVATREGYEATELDNITQIEKVGE